MKLFILICAISTTFANDEKEKEKKNDTLKHILVNGIIHEQKVIINGINRPYQLSYHAKKNDYEVLYFSYNYGRQNESTFEVGFAVNGTTYPDPIPEVKNGFATAVNEEHDFIYYGGSEGIYRQTLSNPTKKVEQIVHKHNIWDLFYKNGLYFVTFPKGKLYKYHVNGSVIQHHIHEKIYNFAIDGDDDIFITNKTGLYMIKNGTQRRIHIKGAKVFRAIAINRKGEAHICGQNEIYIVHKKKHALHEIAKIKNIFGLTFDFGDNIIYSDPHQIVKLLPKEKPEHKKEEPAQKNEEPAHKKEEPAHKKEEPAHKKEDKNINHLIKDKTKEISKIIISNGQPSSLDTVETKPKL